jgi:hypothetical protein
VKNAKLQRNFSKKIFPNYNVVHTFPESVLMLLYDLRSISLISRMNVIVAGVLYYSVLQTVKNLENKIRGVHWEYLAQRNDHF